MTSNAAAIIDKLHTLARPDDVPGMARFGINGQNRLGIKIPQLRKLAQEIGTDHQLALDLWSSGIAEARILAAMVDDVELLDEPQMEDWVKDFNSWDICDEVCMNLFYRSPLAWQKIHDWSKRKEEFVKRAAYAIIACLARHDKETPDEEFTALFPVIADGATDERNFVKKAVNWALRHIGKRNLNLNRAAVTFAEDIRQMDSKAARWIATDAIRELRSEKIQQRLLK